MGTLQHSIHAYMYRAVQCCSQYLQCLCMVLYTHFQDWKRQRHIKTNVKRGVCVYMYVCNFKCTAHIQVGTKSLSVLPSNSACTCFHYMYTYMYIGFAMCTYGTVTKVQMGHILEPLMFWNPRDKLSQWLHAQEMPIQMCTQRTTDLRYLGYTYMYLHACS